jgi:penicillin-binding protein 1A
MAVGAVLFFGWAVSVNFLYLFGPLPSLDRLENPRPPVPSILYSADGVELGRYYRENRAPVPLDSMSPVLIQALKATEDARFEEHAGIDPKALASALWAAASGGDKRGASTITQQLAKNLYKTRGGESARGLMNKIPGLKTLVAKTKEWIVAVQLERTFTKPEIQQLYLNTVDFGSNSFGVKVAARTFFGTTPAALSTAEAAMLVGMLKAPSAYSPRFQPKAALARRNVVLDQMGKYGFLKPDEVQTWQAVPLELKYQPDLHIDGPQAYYRTAVGQALEKWCQAHDRDLYADGLHFYTTIDTRYQVLAEEAVKEQLKQLQNRFDNYWRGKGKPWADEKGKEIPGFIMTAMRRTPYYKALAKRFHGDTALIGAELRRPRPMTVFSLKGPKEEVMSALDSLAYYKRFLRCGMMTMNPNTGQILAWVGGADFNFFKYDHVKQARRQPGSTFKPFVYLTAIDKGYSPCDRIRDQRITIKYEENGEQKEWQPNNVTRSYTGSNMTLRYAMGRSVNSVTAQLTEKVGWGEVAKYAHQMGITSPLLAVPSIGLGSGGDVSIYEMVNAYSTFANGGFRNEPQLLMRVEDRNGNVIDAPQPKQKRVIRAETAYLMQHMLLGTMQEPGGTSQSLWDYPGLWKKGNEIGGKTGTTSNYSDGWYMGVTQDLVTGTWVGGEDRAIHFRTSSTGEGGKTALPVFGRYMVKLYDAGLAERHPFQRPKGLNMPKLNCYTAAPRKAKVDTVATDELLEQLNNGATPPPPIEGVKVPTE